MKRLIFIVEGETEEAFVNNILRPYFKTECNFYNIVCFKLKHSRGGVSKYKYIKNDLVTAINESDAVVTTMIDFYQIPKDVPGYAESLQILKNEQRVAVIEDKIKEDLVRHYEKATAAFIPYIQLHEFEAILFSSDKGFTGLFDAREADFEELQRIMKTFPNPEDIDNGSNTAPSKRLMNCIKGYEKVLYGFALADEIGVVEIMRKCPHFKQWIEKLKRVIDTSNI